MWLVCTDAELLEANERLQKEVHALTEEMGSKTKELTEQLDARQQELVKLADELREARKEIETLTQDRSRQEQQQEQLEEVQRELTDAKQTISDDKQTYEAEIKRLSGRITELEQERATTLAAAEGEGDHPRQPVDSAELQEYKQCLAAASTRCDQLNTKVQSLTTDRYLGGHQCGLHREGWTDRGPALIVCVCVRDTWQKKYEDLLMACKIR